MSYGAEVSQAYTYNDFISAKKDNATRQLKHIVPTIFYYFHNNMF